MPISLGNVCNLLSEIYLFNIDGLLFNKLLIELLYKKK